MAPDPQADRLRLVIESEGDDTGIPGTEEEQVGNRRPEEMIDLNRLDDNRGYEFDDEEGPARPRRVWPAAIAGVALLGFAVGSWYAYRTYVDRDVESAIPLIQADAGPIKTRPAAPGGLDVPHQNSLVLNEITPNPDKPQVERLLPPPEVPKPPIAEVAPMPLPGGSAAPTQTAVAEPGSDPGPAAGPETSPATPPPAAPAAAQSEPAPAPAPAPSTAQAPKTGTPRLAQSAALTGGYLVQLGSLKDKNLVGGEWLRLQKAFPGLLADKRLLPQQADLGSRGIYHRIRAGYFADQASAAATCQAFKAKDQACIVVAP